MKKRLAFFCRTLLALVFLSGIICLDLDASLISPPKNKEFTCTKDLGGDPAKTYWTPWLPLSYLGFRYKVGIIASPGNINLRVPVKVFVTYDPTQAVPGSYLPVTVKVQTLKLDTGENSRNFMADFGVRFPDQLQVGLGVGISGVGNVGTWWDAPGGVGFWKLLEEVLSKTGIPGLDQISRIQNLLAVNMRNAFIPPLGGQELTFSDARDLLTLSLADLITGDALDGNTRLGKCVNTVYGKISSLKPSFISADTAKKAIGKGLEKAFGAVSLGFVGNPEYQWKGRDMRLEFTADITGESPQKFTLYFDQADTDKVFKVFIPWSTSTSDKVTITLDSLGYGVNIRQKLDINCNFSVFDWSPNLADKLAISEDIPPSSGLPWQIVNDIPVQQAPSNFGGVDVQAGCQSARVVWYNPNLLSKGKIQVFSGGTQVAYAEDTLYSSNHSLVVTGLNPNTTYSVSITGTDSANQPLSGSLTRNFTTLNQCKPRSDQANVSGSNLRVSNITRDSAVISWSTDDITDGMVLYGASPDYGITSTIAWDGADDQHKNMGKTHSIYLRDLQAGTKYYFSAVSWTFRDPSKPNVDNLSSWEKANQTFTTLPPPPKPNYRVKVRTPGGTLITGVPVVVEKNGVGTFSANTDANGMTPYFVLDYGAGYAFNVEAPCYQLKDNIKPTVTIPASVTDAQRPQYLDQTKELLVERGSSLGGLVMDSRGGAAISGATVAIASPSLTATTDAAGVFNFTSLTTPGTYQMTISKSGYFTANATGSVDSCGLFRGGTVYLSSNSPRLTVSVQKQQGNTFVAYASCPVTVKEGNTTLNPTLTTDANGNATWIPTTNFADTASHTLTVSVNPPSGSNLGATQEEVTIANGQDISVSLVCPQADVAAPVVSNLVMTRNSLSSCGLNFKTDEPAKVITAKMLLGTQTIGQSSENSYSFDHNLSVTFSATYLNPGQGVSPAQINTAKIELTLDDLFGNRRVENHDIPLGTQPPNTSGVIFRKVMDGLLQEVTTAETGEAVTIVGIGRDPDGYVVSQAWTITGEEPQTYNEMDHIETRLLTQPQNLQVSVTFTDDTGLTYTVSKELTVTEKPPAANIIGPVDPLTRPGEQVNLSVEANSNIGLSEIAIGWGDGAQQTVPLAGEKIKTQIFSHAYSKPGKYNFTAQAKSTNNVASALARKEISIFNRPSCSLSLSGNSPYAANSTVSLEFSIQAPGGFSWEILRNGLPFQSGTEQGDSLTSSAREVALKENTEAFVVKVTDSFGQITEAAAVALVGKMGEVTGRSFPSLQINPSSGNIGQNISASITFGARQLTKEEIARQKQAGQEGAQALPAGGREAVGSLISGGVNREIGTQALKGTKGSRGEQPLFDYSQICLDWGDGIQQALGLEPSGQSTWQHEYTRPGTFTVKAMLLEEASGNWINAGTARAVIVSTPFAVNLTSLDPNPALIGSAIAFSAQAQGLNAGKWEMKAYKIPDQNPLFQKEINQQVNSVSETLPSASWPAGAYRLTLKATSITGVESQEFDFPFIIREVRPALIIPNTGNAGEAVNGLIALSGEAASFGDLKLVMDLGDGKTQELSLKEAVKNEQNILNVSFSYVYEKPGNYNITVSLKRGSANLSAPVSRSIKIIEKPAEVTEEGMILSRTEGRLGKGKALMGIVAEEREGEGVLGIRKGSSGGAVTQAVSGTAATQIGAGGAVQEAVTGTRQLAKAGPGQQAATTAQAAGAAASASTQKTEATEEALGKKEPAALEKILEPVDLSIEGIKIRQELLAGVKADIEVEVRNNSAASAPDALVVFKSEDGALEQKKITLRPNSREALLFGWSPKKPGKQRVIFAVEYKGDTRLNNNQLSETVEVVAPETVDLSITDIVVEAKELAVEKPAEILVLVANGSGIAAEDATVALESEDGLREKEKISLKPNGKEKMRFTWTPRKPGRQTLTARVELNEDTNTRNNELRKKVEVLSPEKEGLPLEK